METSREILGNTILVQSPQLKWSWIPSQIQHLEDILRPEIEVTLEVKHFNIFINHQTIPSRQAV